MSKEIELCECNCLDCIKYDCCLINNDISKFCIDYKQGKSILRAIEGVLPATCGYFKFNKEENTKGVGE